MNSDVHDNQLFEILKECRTIPIFFDHLFGFLSRRTDFYVETNEANAPVGLQQGIAEKLLRDTYYSYKEQQEIPHKQTKNIINNQIKQCTNEIIENILSEVVNEETINQCAAENQIALRTENSEKQPFTPSEYYNGATYGSYGWSQDLCEVTLVCRPPDVSHKINTRDVAISITSTHISVSFRGETLISGELCERCKANEAIWSLQNDRVEIHLDKVQEKWWDCLVKAEPRLDISTLDCTRPYEELSEEAQVKIDELRWNQEQKRLGLPTSEEIEMERTLKKAWNLEGSPFSGDYTPGAVKFN